MNLDTQLTIPPQVMSRQVDDETVVLDLKSGMYFGLDGVGKLIWESVEQGLSLKGAVDSVISEYDVETERATADVLEFAGDLVDRGFSKSAIPALTDQFSECGQVFGSAFARLASPGKSAKNITDLVVQEWRQARQPHPVLGSESLGKSHSSARIRANPL